MIAAWELGWEIGETIRAIPIGDGRNLGEAIDEHAAETYGEGYYEYQCDVEANGGGITGHAQTYYEYWCAGWSTLW